MTVNDYEIKPRADLTYANLTGADLIGADLTYANLTGADLTGADLTYANLTGANLTRANLTRANLTGASLRDAVLTGAILTGANLTCTRGIIYFKFDPRDYILVMFNNRGGSHGFTSGCKSFASAEEAIVHWGSDGYEDQERGQMYVDAIKFMDKMEIK